MKKMIVDRIPDALKKFRETFFKDIDKKKTWDKIDVKILFFNLYDEMLKELLNQE